MERYTFRVVSSRVFQKNASLPKVRVGADIEEYNDMWWTENIQEIMNRRVPRVYLTSSNTR
jgi:hypothetical protein